MLLKKQDARRDASAKVLSRLGKIRNLLDLLGTKHILADTDVYNFFDQYSTVDALEKEEFLEVCTLSLTHTHTHFLLTFLCVRRLFR